MFASETMNRKVTFIWYWKSEICFRIQLEHLIIKRDEFRLQGNFILYIISYKFDLLRIKHMHSSFCHFTIYRKTKPHYCLNKTIYYCEIDLLAAVLSRSEKLVLQPESSSSLVDDETAVFVSFVTLVYRSKSSSHLVADEPYYFYIASNI